MMPQSQPRNGIPIVAATGPMLTRDPMGILLAVPLTAFVKLVADCHQSLIHISNLLAENPRPVPNWAQMSQQKVTQAIPFLRKRFRVAPKDLAAKD
jgi:hypothetical protein